MVVESLAPPVSSGVDLMNPCSPIVGGIAHVCSGASIEAF
jgi:hypothetical protein